ncbi:MAG TPA: CRISPR-associated endonuclease Cas1 [Acidobacteriota bacterium]|nr:CRISPR-associated endonuclease Cas1 [Acidobacteriota bacterium]
MASLVISSETISVRLISKHLEVIRWVEWGKKAESRMRVPLVDVDRVVVVGYPSISLPVLYRLLRNGVPCFFLSSKGHWVGSLTPDNNKNAGRRLRQYQVANDSEFALRVARKLIWAKLRNSRRVLQRLSANRDESHLPEQERVDRELMELAGRAAEASSLEELRGYEGLAAARYFNRLGSFFPENVPFGGRSRRPPRDAANALLSWTYSVVLGEVDGCVRGHGLDACLGFLHGIQHGTPSLSLDLLEPLRGPVCDLLVLNLLNHRVLTEANFRFDSASGGFYLKEESRKTFFSSYEATMTRQFIPAKGQPHTDFRRIIESSVTGLLRAMEGDELPEFFLMP